MIIHKLDKISDVDFFEGATVLVNKPLKWTSFDVVNKLRYAIKRKLGVKKIKVGHAGTLDPLATGLLIIAIGRDTKKINNYQNMDKVYTGKLVIGATTKSFDAEFEPENFIDTDHVTSEMIEETRKSFVGLIEQIPPKFSAVKIEGETAYRLARKWVDFVIKKRQVNIYEFDISKFEENEIDFKVVCQKGTYIRSLANDFGVKLGTGAYLAGLRRERIGEYDISDSFELEDLVKILDEK